VGVPLLERGKGIADFVQGVVAAMGISICPDATSAAISAMSLITKTFQATHCFDHIAFPQRL